MGCGGWTGVLHRHPFKWEPATRGAVSWESPDAAPSRSTLVFRPRPYRKCPSGSGVGARLWPFLLKVDYLGNLGPKLRTGLRLSPHCSVVWGFFLPSLPPPRPSSSPPHPPPRPSSRRHRCQTSTVVQCFSLPTSAPSIALRLSQATSPVSPLYFKHHLYKLCFLNTNSFSQIIMVEPEIFYVYIRSSLNSRSLE